MIANRADLRLYLAADLMAAQRHNKVTRWLPVYSRLRYPVLAWQRSLRRCEYRANTKGLWTLFRPLDSYLFRRRSIKLGFDIPLNVFGPGLSIAHWGSVIANGNARVGANARVHPGTVLGEKDGFAPTIGNDVYLGPGVKVLGGITLGHNVTCGANAVIVKSFGNDLTLVGVPARQISTTEPSVPRPDPESAPAGESG